MRLAELSDVLDEVQRVTGWRRDDCIFAASAAMLRLPIGLPAEEQNRLLLGFLLAGAETQPWRAA